MLDFEKQQLVEDNYFNGDEERKQLYLIVKKCIDKATGYEDPLKKLTLTGNQRKLALEDYSNIHKDSSFDLEAFCKDMLESKIAYSWFKGMSGQEVLENSPSYLYDYIIVFGKEQIIEWLDELINKVAYVDRNCYADSEGCLYNSIVWKE